MMKKVTIKAMAAKPSQNGIARRLNIPERMREGRLGALSYG